MKLRKSAGGLLSDFYDRWAEFEHEMCFVAVNAQIYKTRRTRRFGMWGHTHFGSGFPQALTDKSD